MYSDLVFYLCKYIDINILFYFSLSVVIGFVIIGLAFYSVERYDKKLKIVVDKWYSGKHLTKREEKMFYEYQEYREKLCK